MRINFRGSEAEHRNIYNFHRLFRGTIVELLYRRRIVPDPAFIIDSLKYNRMDILKESLAFSGFSVNDFEKAKEFYGDVLGLDIAESKEMKGILHLHLAGGNTVLIYTKPDHTPASFTILNFPVKNIETATAALKGQGITFEKYDGMNIGEDGIFRGGGPLIAWFKDPAGNVLSVIEED
jgi:predicted enzyme related to lactoylglutathione lyase